MHWAQKPAVVARVSPHQNGEELPGEHLPGGMILSGSIPHSRTKWIDAFWFNIDQTTIHDSID